MPSQSNTHVILLHGLGRNASIMASMGDFLKAHDYCVHNIDYSPTTESLEVLATRVEAQLKTLDLASEECMLVAHSLGAIITRFLLVEERFPFPLKRCVFLGPPNQGSRLVQCLKRLPLYRRRYPGAGQQIGRDKESWPRRLPSSIPCECGIVSGEGAAWQDYFFAFIVLPLLAGRWVKSDGKLLTEEQALPGVPQKIIKGAKHPSLPSHPDVQQAVLSFLKKGAF